MTNDLNCIGSIQYEDPCAGRMTCGVVLEQEGGGYRVLRLVTLGHPPMPVARMTPPLPTFGRLILDEDEVAILDQDEYQAPACALVEAGILRGPVGRIRLEDGARSVGVYALCGQVRETL